jgi:hypothetical protein
MTTKPRVLAQLRVPPRLLQKYALSPYVSAAGNT